ncbi:hypothetical protein OF83DRAFT_1172770 [Amylostereum chailletii]|nr:hypothetical protein OF83DRAFT_1172770 [Amylostereum chailletii]
MSLEYFSEEHSKALLSKEWLVKVDAEASVPYLMKFHASFVDQTCVFMITDTKTVWAEVLSSKQLSRRWYNLNPASSPSQYPPPSDAHEGWLDQVLQYLFDAHTLGGMDELSLDMTDTHYSDLAIELGGEAFKWRWETFLIGPKFSAEVLSRHLIQPLISTVHLAFTSSDPVCDMSEGDLEKAVDKIGRTARRSVDTHLKNAITRPRVSTTLRRMSALFDFNPTLPRILSESDRPDLRLPRPPSLPSRPVSSHSAKNTRINDMPRSPPKARSPNPEVGWGFSILSDIRFMSALPMYSQNLWQWTNLNLNQKLAHLLIPVQHILSPQEPP